MRITAPLSIGNDNFRRMTSTRGLYFRRTCPCSRVGTRVSIAVLRTRQPDRIAARVPNRIKKSQLLWLDAIIVFTSQAPKQLHYTLRWIEIVSLWRQASVKRPDIRNSAAILVFRGHCFLYFQFWTNSWGRDRWARFIIERDKNRWHFPHFLYCCSRWLRIFCRWREIQLCMATRTAWAYTFVLRNHNCVLLHTLHYHTLSYISFDLLITTAV